jgi:flagellar biosynthetic protein FlhB
MHATGFALARFLTPILLVLIGFGLVASLAQRRD